MDKEKIIEIIHFDCSQSLKYLLERRLKEENLSTKAINQIKLAYELLELNLTTKLTDNTL